MRDPNLSIDPDADRRSLGAVGSEPLTPREYEAYDRRRTYGGESRSVVTRKEGNYATDTLPGKHPEVEVWIGNDDRKGITEHDFPYNCIAHLQCHRSDGKVEVATGFLISPFCVITAGHCISPSRGTWVNSVTVIPAMRFDSARVMLEPFGHAIATRFRSVDGWFTDRDDDYDYGAVILPDDGLSERIGAHLGFRPYSDALGGSIEVAGYPLDRDLEFLAGCGKVFEEYAFLIRHDADTAGGNSGSPIYDRTNGVVIGVHTGGNAAAQYNEAVKLRPEVAKVWEDWTHLLP